MDTGSICADIKPVENKRVGFTVKTPAVTASVRGTAGYVYAYGKVVKEPFILEDHPEDYCNNQNTVDVEIIDIKYSISNSVFSEEQIYCFSALIIYNETN